MRAFLTVDYDDGNQSTYRGLNIHVSETDENIRFDTGDPLIDWYEYGKFVYNGEALSKGIEHIGYSSNVDHWFIDGDNYVEEYFDSDTFQFIDNDTLMKMPMREWDEKYLKCVVTNDMKDFNDLKEYYKSKVK